MFVLLQGQSGVVEMFVRISATKCRFVWSSWFSGMIILMDYIKNVVLNCHFRMSLQ